MYIGSGWRRGGTHHQETGEFSATRKDRPSMVGDQPEQEKHILIFFIAFTYYIYSNRRFCEHTHTHTQRRAIIDGHHITQKRPPRAKLSSNQPAQKTAQLIIEIRKIETLRHHIYAILCHNDYCDIIIIITIRRVVGRLLPLCVSYGLRSRRYCVMCVCHHVCV